MNINISAILDAKLEQMDRDGVIKQKIEESLEKVILNAVSSELESYTLKKQIGEKVRESVGGVADQLGLSAYNGFLSERVRDIVRDLYTEDIAQKVQTRLENVLLKKYDQMKLSDIFRAYRKWVHDFVDQEDQREREYYTGSLDVRYDGAWTVYTCCFSAEPDQEETPDVMIRIQQYRFEPAERIGTLYLDGRDMQHHAKIGYLSEFEAMVANLYYNETPIELDGEAVETDTYFEAALED
ncbi:hypothetical protein [uncultured Oscillibacter sp.]|uniref:hypothetical protein n=1 Tax=uncultured Oscillibacter sp. TaxID=876091 RepID=UPI0026269041|nr:hypothetical protein [uncultured Oscillibacter sp.]